MLDNAAKPTGPQAQTVECIPAYADSSNDVPRYTSASVLRLLWDKRQILSRWLMYGFASSIMLAFLIPSRFESAARLMPPDQQNSSMAMLAAAATGGWSGSGATSGLGSGLGSIAGDLLGMKSSGELFIGILQSRTVEDDLINKFNLRKVYRDRYMEDARKDLNDKTDVSEDRKSGIVTIRVVDKDPQRAAALVQEYVSELNRVVVLLNTSSAHREREFLEGRLVQVKQDLESAENGFSDFASKNSALDIPAQGKAMIEASAALEGQFIAAQTELASLKQIYADGNVRVHATQARVDELRHQLDKLGGKFDSAGSVSNQNQTTQSQNDQSMYPSIRRLPVLGVKYADLYRTTKVQEAVFETLTQEYELAKVQEAKETPSVKVLDPPNIPEKKFFPSRMLVVALGTMFALSLSVVSIFGKVYWTEMDSQDPHKVLAVEITQATRARLPWGLGDGSGNGHSNGRFWSRSSGKDNGLDN